MKMFALQYEAITGNSYWNDDAGEFTLQTPTVYASFDQAVEARLNTGCADSVRLHVVELKPVRADIDDDRR